MRTPSIPLMPALLVLVASPARAQERLPSSFDLRDVGPFHESLVTSVKTQLGGTCPLAGWLARSTRPRGLA